MKLQLDRGPSAADIRAALCCGKAGCPCQKDGNVHCPAHDDPSPSLSVSETDDGTVLVHCFAGCTQEAVIAALRERGLWGGGEGVSISPDSFAHSNSAGLTLAEYAAAKGLPVEFLQGLGLRDVHYLGSPAVRIPYLGADGTELPCVRFRLNLKNEPRFKWRSGSKLHLYGLWQLERARTAGYVVLCEGESDVQSLLYHDVPALGIPGANNWKEEWATLLDGIATICVWIEPDKGGQAMRRWVSKSALRDRVRLISIAGAKDPSALFLDNPARFRERWAAACAEAVPWPAIAEEARREKGSAAYALARDLLHDPALLERVGDMVRRRGFAGAVSVPQLVYLAVTSRLLERPLNLAIVAPSAAGKNRAVDAALELIPEDAVHIERAGSARALVYVEADFEHKTVLVSEADSIPEDGPAASAVRSLAADNVLAYDVVEKNPSSGQFETRRVIKPGPTGLLTTSTRSLPEQMSTRTLEVPIPDSPDQTRAVCRAHAAGVMPALHDHGPDLRPFLAVQQWLESAGIHQVAIPFAAALAELVPPAAVRMRRDFRQLLTTIQTVALLGQLQREQTPEGWIVATLDDYAQARALLAPVFDVIAAEGVTTAIRDTVEAIGPNEELTQAALAQRLRLSTSTVSWRTRKALAGGFLVNREQRKHHPMRLARGAPLPEETTILPPVEQLRDVFESANDSGMIDPPSPPSPDDAAAPPGIPLGVAQIDPTRLQELLDAGLDQAAAREQARVPDADPLTWADDDPRLWAGAI